MSETGGLYARPPVFIIHLLPLSTTSQHPRRESMMKEMRCIDWFDDGFIIRVTPRTKKPSFFYPCDCSDFSRNLLPFLQNFFPIGMKHELGWKNNGMFSIRYLTSKILFCGKA